MIAHTIKKGKQNEIKNVKCSFVKHTSVKSSATYVLPPIDLHELAEIIPDIIFG